MKTLRSVILLIALSLVFVFGLSLGVYTSHANPDFYRQFALFRSVIPAQPLEIAAKKRLHIVLDKTGTITLGTPRVIHFSAYERRAPGASVDERRQAQQSDSRVNTDRKENDTDRQKMIYSRD